MAASAMRRLARRVGLALGILLAGVFVLVALSWLRMLWTEDLTERVAAPATGRWIRAHDVDLFVQEFGDAAAPVLLLTHGTGAWSGTWVSNVQAMAAAGYRVVAIDLPPFGFSTRPANGDYGRTAQAQRILALADALGKGPVTLLGHSYGGGPAAEAAMLGPARVRRLILVDAAIGLRPEGIPVAAPEGPIRALLDVRPLRTALVATLATQPLLTGHWLRQFVARKEAVTPARSAIYREPFPVRGFSAALGDWGVQFAGESGSSRSEQAEGFRNLRVPLTLVWGAEDSITPLDQARTLNALAAGSRLVILPGVGHIPQIEDVELFNRRIVEVLRSTG